MIRTRQCPLEPPTEKDWARFWAKVMPIPECGCWVWMSATDGAKGYGKFWYRGESVYAHIFSFTYFIRRLPLDKLHDHWCKVKPCVNPWHLFEATPRDNTLRGDAEWQFLYRPVKDYSGPDGDDPYRI